MPTVCVLASCYGSSNVVHQDHTANCPHWQKSSLITLYFDSTTGDVTSGGVLGFDSLSLSLNIYSKVRCFAQFRLATANHVQRQAVHRWLRRSGATLRLCSVIYSVMRAAGRSGRLWPIPGRVHGPVDTAQCPPARGDGSSHNVRSQCRTTQRKQPSSVQRALCSISGLCTLALPLGGGRCRRLFFAHLPLRAAAGDIIARTVKCTRATTRYRQHT